MGVRGGGPTGAGGLSPHAWRSRGKGTCGHGTRTARAGPRGGAGGGPGSPGGRDEGTGQASRALVRRRPVGASG